MINKLAEAMYGPAGSRACLRCHTPMDKQPGVWVLQQVQRLGLLGPSNGNLHPTGKLLTLEPHVCPKCGSIELVNERGA